MSRAVDERDQKSQTRLEAAALLALAILGAVYLVFAFRLPLGILAFPGFGFFPVLVGGLVTFAALVALAQTFVGRGGSQTELGGYGRGGAVWRVPVILAAIVGYVLIAGWAGHAAAAGALSAAVLYVLNPRRRWWQIALLAVLLATGSYLLFEELLGLRLPQGSLL